MRIEYELLGYGIYRLKLTLKNFHMYISEPVMGFATDAEEEVLLIGKWNLTDIMRLHDWKRY